MIDERSLLESDLDADPLDQFRTWLNEAAGEHMPNAMALATVGPDGLPTVRMVLLEEVDAGGFCFQTNLESPKARDLAAVPNAAATFFWPGLLRQVRVNGTVEELARDQVLRYFSQLAPGIQAMLRACRQSDVIPDRAALEECFAQAVASGDVSLPDHWGGYRLRVESIEFWQGRANWLQDRLRYTRDAKRGGWRIERLVP